MSTRNGYTFTMADHRIGFMKAERRLSYRAGIQGVEINRLDLFMDSDESIIHDSFRDVNG